MHDLIVREAFRSGPSNCIQNLDTGHSSLRPTPRQVLQFFPCRATKRQNTVYVRAILGRLIEDFNVSVVFCPRGCLQNSCQFYTLLIDGGILFVSCVGFDHHCIFSLVASPSNSSGPWCGIDPQMRRHCVTTICRRPRRTAYCALGGPRAAGRSPCHGSWSHRDRRPS